MKTFILLLIIIQALGSNTWYSDLNYNFTIAEQTYSLKLTFNDLGGRGYWIYCFDMPFSCFSSFPSRYFLSCDIVYREQVTDITAYLKTLELCHGSYVITQIQEITTLYQPLFVASYIISGVAVLMFIINIFYRCYARLPPLSEEEPGAAKPDLPVTPDVIPKLSAPISDDCHTTALAPIQLQYIVPPIEIKISKKIDSDEPETYNKLKKMHILTYINIIVYVATMVALVVTNTFYFKVTGYI